MTDVERAKALAERLKNFAALLAGVYSDGRPLHDIKPEDAVEMAEAADLFDALAARLAPPEDVAGLVAKLDDLHDATGSDTAIVAAAALTALSARAQEAEARLAECEPWLKPGETPAQRIEREFNEHNATGFREAAALRRAEEAEAREARLRAEALEEAMERLRQKAEALRKVAAAADHTGNVADQHLDAAAQVETCIEILSTLKEPRDE